MDNEKNIIETDEVDTDSAYYDPEVDGEYSPNGGSK